MEHNPFLITGYIDSSHFCNRENETATLIDALENNRSITLVSLRRMGKTGLIKHLFHKLDKKTDCVYIDIMPTSNLAEFTQTFGNAVINQLTNPLEKGVKNVFSVFKKLSPTLTVDPLSGQPSFEINVASGRHSESTLEEIFNYLKSRKKKTIIAIDEFQQITGYPEKKTEALLRSYIQHLNNSVFIFSGSQPHLLTQMFSSATKPFYQSTQFLFLDHIEAKAYEKFIVHHFSAGKKKISPAEIEIIFEWSRLHTYYVQLLCNKLFTRTEKELTSAVLLQTLQTILLENEPYYYSYKNLLTDQQWNLLKAIAREGRVDKINRKTFLNQYHLSSSTVQRSIKALEERELVVNEKGSYRIYDVFLGCWLANKF